MPLTQLAPQHLRNLRRVIQFPVQNLDPHSDVQGAAHHVVVAFQPQFVPAVPEEVREGIGEFGVEVQLGADGEELACLLEDRGAGVGEAGAVGEEAGDGERGGEVGREEGFEHGEFGAAGEAGGEGDFGEDGVDGAGRGVVVAGGFGVQESLWVGSGDGI